MDIPGIALGMLPSPDIPGVAVTSALKVGLGWATG
jgi:hypothetical protein